MKQQQCEYMVFIDDYKLVSILHTEKSDLSNPSFQYWSQLIIYTVDHFATNGDRTGVPFMMPLSTTDVYEKMSSTFGTVVVLNGP